MLSKAFDIWMFPCVDYYIDEIEHILLVKRRKQKWIGT